MPAPQPGLLVLHGNRLELLTAAVLEWLGAHPLAPLQEEVFLVQSNAIAEWLKVAIAARQGICAATRTELPARFLWRTYRAALGPGRVPVRSPLDRSVLTWRLMRLLPRLVQQPGFEPLRHFLDPVDDAARRLQLAQQLADLYDQYQVYRADWLEGWAHGGHGLSALPGSVSEPLSPDQRWQAELWRAVLEELTPEERATARPGVHARALAALEGGEPLPQAVAPRVVLFGVSHLPLQTLEALAALATRSQVLLAIPNPCRYHWGDIVEGRELLRAARRRHPDRAMDLAQVAPEELHAHAHPLLAAWGRQGRDFIRQLDAYDDSLAARQRFAIPRIDLFDGDDDEAQGPLLQQVQACIRDLVPLAEHEPQGARLSADDRSIVFHVAHGMQREVEVLHDQLLALLAEARGRLAPRDIVVMVPDVDAFAPSIRAVFGQHAQDDPRCIPYGIVDLRQRGANPLLIAAEWLLRLPQQRCRLAEVRDLLDVPAIAARFGVEPEALPVLTRWMEGAGVRWGLHAEQRASLGLHAVGEQNSWFFGLSRMLLGYASGRGAAFGGIEPYAEVGGLEASLAGSLAALVQALDDWWRDARRDRTPDAWAERARKLLDTFFLPQDEYERLTVAALQEGLRRWQDDAATAGFTEPVPLGVMREAWLQAVDEPGLGRRFMSGGVTFCTLLPMRAVPFQVVCLLGMNDGSYPRSSARSDFDLMGWPGQRRPGDRARRDDDRYLMLEALLSARQVLYVSWTGKSVRDNSLQPPSVLVSQLRDYLDAGWGPGTAAARTTEHPLQPFSRRYFERGSREQHGLFTYAGEWRQAHGAEPQPAPISSPEEPVVEDVATVDAAALASFLRQPVRAWFRERLGVALEAHEEASEDDEPFGLQSLEEYALLQELLQGVEAGDDDAGTASRIERLKRRGVLPLAASGQLLAAQLAEAVAPMREAWRRVHRPQEEGAPGQRLLRFEHGGLAVQEWVEASPAGSNEGGEGAIQAMPAEDVQLLASRLTRNVGRAKQPRPERLFSAWVRMLVASAGGQPQRMRLIGRDAVLTTEPLPQDDARRELEVLLQAYREGLREPLPVAQGTAVAYLANLDFDEARAHYEGSASPQGGRGEVELDRTLARVYPNFDALDAGDRFAEWALRLYGPIVAWSRSGVTVDTTGYGGSAS